MTNPLKVIVSGTIDDLFATIDNSHGDHLEEYYIPLAEPWLTEWCLLHSLHLEALRHVDDESRPIAEIRHSLCGAVELAEMKFKLYVASIEETHATSVVTK